MGEWTVGVCGFGRCGSTMVMSMLRAGGLSPVDASPRPPYELYEYREAWGTPLCGRAIKLLSLPQAFGYLPPARQWRFVWLDRDPVQQARSQIKFLDSLLPGTPASGAEDAVLRFAASFERDRPGLLGMLRRHGPVLVLRYERILGNPRRAAKQLRQVWPRLDVDAAAAVVHERSGQCRPDLAIETATVSEGQG